MGGIMITIELTQIQADRWNHHLADGRNATGGIGSPPSSERKQDAILAYQKSGSLGHVCRELCMGRNTLKRVLRANGVLV